MSTKSEITTSINTIDTGGSNTALEVRTTLGVIRDAYYGTAVTDTNASTNVVTESASTKTYSLSIKKQGGIVRVKGTIFNNTGAITPSDTDWFTITTTEYQQLSGSPVYITGTVGGSNENVQLILTTNVFGALNPIGIGETVYIDFEYFTNA